MQVNILHDLIKHTKNLNVLYIEDNIEVQTQTVKMLKSFFNSINIADNGKIGLELFLDKNSYHIIITDIKMPIIDGLSLIETIRKTDKKIPIIVLSAHDDKDYFLKTINAGIDGYILKPYNLAQITETLTKIIEKYDFENILKEIIDLDFGFSWNRNINQLSKDNQQIKLSKNETKLFQLFINSNDLIRSYREIETFVFDCYENDMKKIRNLMSRLKLKLDYDLFETIYSHGYSLKYKQ
jgi:two-component system, OmpR family, response regulator VanR